jgi:hypothetical protein
LAPRLFETSTREATITKKVTYIGKGNFGTGPFLKEQVARFLIKQKDGKGSMQDGMRSGGCKFMRASFGFGTNDIVLIIQYQNSILLHHVFLRHGGAIPCCGRHFVACFLSLCVVLMLVVEKMTMQIKFVSRNGFLNAKKLGWRWRQKSKSLHPS